MQIEGKTAIVTGGSSGIGKVIAQHLISVGANVVFTSRNKEKGNKVLEELGPKAAFANVDVTTSEQVKVAVDMAIERFGKIDIVVNCAGISDAMRMLGKKGPHTMEHFKRVVETNFYGTFDTIRQSLVHMAENPIDETGERGVIVNIGSIAGMEAMEGQVAYCASKAAVAGMTLTMARDIAKYAVRVCTVAPGLIASPMSEAMNPAVQTMVDKNIAYPVRYGEALEVAKLVQHVIENTYLNGEVIRIDGGLRMPKSL